MSSPGNKLLNRAIDDAYENCVPIFTTIEIGLACNFKCVHCYNFDRTVPFDTSLLGKPLQSNEIIDIIGQVSDVGALYITFSGGEPLAHPDLELFIKEVIKNNSVARIKTNGSLLTKERCKTLSNAGLSTLDISLYGLNNEDYEEFTGIKDGFDKTLSGILNAKKSNFELNVNIVIHRKNAKDLREMINLLTSIGVSYQFSDEITERYDGSSGSRNCALSESEFTNLLNSDDGELFFSHSDEVSLQCACARSVCGISSTGEVYPCIGAPVPSGNLRDMSFRRIWEESIELNKIRNINEDSFKECKSCDFKSFCTRSSGAIYANTSNYTGCDEDTIMRARSRSKVASKFLKKP